MSLEECYEHRPSPVCDVCDDVIYNSEDGLTLGDGDGRIDICLNCMLIGIKYAVGEKRKIEGAQP